MTQGHYEVQGFPQTHYSVALLWFHKTDSRHIVASRLITVSGKNPLVAEEAVARARKQVEEKWKDAEWGPLSEWNFRSSAIESMTQTLTPPTT